MTNPSDIFDAFIRAKAAMDKVPELESKITSLTGELSVASEIINLFQQDLSKAHNERDNALDRLSALEVALEGARKSEADIASRLDLVIGTLRDLGGNIGTALSVVAPEPTPEPLVESIGVMADPVPDLDPTAIPAGRNEAILRDCGEVWFDTNGHFHKGIKSLDTKVRAEVKAQEAPADATHPFAASTANPSPVVESVAPTSTPVQVAKPLEDVSLPESPWLKWGV